MTCDREQHGKPYNNQYISDILNHHKTMLKRYYFTVTGHATYIRKVECHSCQVNMWSSYANLLNILCKLKVIK
jgi:hypothetical protein